MCEEWEPKPNLFDAASRLNSQSQSSGEKNVRAERTTHIIYQSYGSGLVRQTQRSPVADIQRAREIRLSVFRKPEDSEERPRVRGRFDGVATAG